MGGFNGNREGGRHTRILPLAVRLVVAQRVGAPARVVDAEVGGGQLGGGQDGQGGGTHGDGYRGGRKAYDVDRRAIDDEGERSNEVRRSGNPETEGHDPGRIGFLAARACTIYTYLIIPKRPSPFPLAELSPVACRHLRV